MTPETRPATLPKTSTRHSAPVVPANTATRNGSDAANRNVARIIGSLILAGWLTYGPGSGLTASLLGGPDYLTDVAANVPTFAIGGVLMLLNSAAVVGIGVWWYPVLKRHSERVALTYLSTRIIEAVLCAVGVISLLSIIGIGDAYTSGANGAHLEALGAMAVDMNELSYAIGMAALGVGSLFFCHLLYRTELVPRKLAASGLAGYAIFAIGMVLDIFGYGIGLILSIPGGLFELVFATWLIIKGFNRQ